MADLGNARYRTLESTTGVSFVSAPVRCSLATIKLGRNDRKGQSQVGGMGVVYIAMDGQTVTSVRGKTVRLCRV